MPLHQDIFNVLVIYTQFSKFFFYLDIILIPISTLLRCIISDFFQYSYKIVQPLPLPNSKRFSSPHKEAMDPLTVTLHSLTTLASANTFYLYEFAYFGQFTQMESYMIFCVRSLLFSIMFLFILLLNTCGYTTFIYSFVKWWTSWLFPLFSSYE